MVITTAAIATGVADFALDKTKDALVDLVKNKVIGRWSEHRAQRFFDAFIDEVRKEKDVRTTSADLNDKLRAIANSDESTSAVFDAYRRVALSASKDIGPMVIGLLTAHIVLESRSATEIEEMVFAGAEVLNDRDFTSFRAWMTGFVHEDRAYASNLTQQKTGGRARESISVLAKGDYQPPVTVTSSGRGATVTYQPRVPMTTDEGPLNLFNDIGPFALKLRNVGLLEESSSPRGHPRNPDGTNYFVRVSPACEDLFRLAVRASEAAAIKRSVDQGVSDA